MDSALNTLRSNIWTVLSGSGARNEPSLLNPEEEELGLQFDHGAARSRDPRNKERPHFVDTWWAEDKPGRPVQEFLHRHRRGRRRIEDGDTEIIGGICDSLRRAGVPLPGPLSSRQCSICCSPTPRSPGTRGVRLR